MNTSKKLAKSLGLSEYESEIYVTLQNRGSLHVKDISKYSTLPRTAVYPPLEKLLKTGLVSLTVFGKRKYYSAIPTNNLKDVFEEKRQLIESAISELNESRQIASASAKL